MKYYVTADPHGFYDELKNSLAESGFFEEKERKKLIVCGDLFDRGTQAKELQEFLVRLLERDEVVLIRGNHEDLATELLHNAWKYFASESSAIQSHHYLNGTVDTLLALTDRTLSEAVSDARSFYFAATETPFFSRLIPAMCDYFETERHIFVHGWIPCRTEGSFTAPAAYRYLPDWRRAEKQEWIKNNAKLYDQISQIEAERDATISDFKMKLSNLKTMSSKAVANAQAARDRYNQAVNSLRSQLSIVQSRLDAELKAKLAKNNPFAVAQDAVQVKLNDVYAIMEIVGKDDNLVAKLINKNGDTFLVKKGTVLQTGHVINDISETFISATLNGVQDYLFFSAGGILDAEPPSGINSQEASTTAKKNAGNAQAKAGTPSVGLFSSEVPSLGKGMFVK